MPQAVNRFFLLLLALSCFHLTNAQYYSQYDPNSYQYQYQQPNNYNNNWQQNQPQYNTNNNFGWREVAPIDNYQNTQYQNTQYQNPIQLTPQMVQENYQWPAPQDSFVQSNNPNNQWLQYPPQQPDNNQFISQTQYVDQNQYVNQNQFFNQNQNQYNNVNQNQYVNNQYQEPLTTKEEPKLTTAKLVTQHNIKDVGNTVVNDDCMKCLCFIESWCSDVGCVMDQGSLSCGWYQLKYEYWLDCGQPGGDWTKCSNSKSCAEGCVKQYMNRYGVFCSNANGGPPRCQDLARIHNGGPHGCSSNSTEYYGWLISRCLKRESPYENIDSYNIPTS